RKDDTAKLTTALPVLFDKLSTTGNPELPARVNLNTAPAAVLAALPGLSTDGGGSSGGAGAAGGSTQGLVEEIVRLRKDIAGDADPIYQTPAWLLIKSPGTFTPDKLRALDRYLTARTQVYRVQVVGDFAGGGPSARVEAVIDTSAKR